MKLRYLIILLVLWSCNSSKMCAIQNTSAESPIVGTWKLLSGTTIQQNDTTYTDYTKNQEVIKIINTSHFSFLRHDLSQGKDSVTIFVSGGGRYTLNGNTYTEYLDFCNYREWENNTFEFTVKIENDTLVQSGIEKVESIGVNRINIEKYVKIK